MAYYYRAIAKGKLGNIKGEIEDFSRAIQYEPNFENAFTQRGLAKYKKGDRTGACLDLNKAVKLGSEDAYNFLIQYCK